MQLEVITRTPTVRRSETPLLFVHGAWHGAWCWDEYFLPYMAEEGYEAYALSLRGHGKSPGRERLRWTSIHDYVADIASVASQLPASPVLIGHSMGGYLTQKYLEKHPAKAAVLVASIPHIGTLPYQLRALRDHPIDYLRAITRFDLYQMIRTSDRARARFFSADMPDADLNRFYRQMHTESFRMALETIFILPRPGRVNVPMLVLAADADDIFPIREEEATARAYGANFRSFPMAHDMMLEAGWRDVASAVVDWLRARDI